MWNIFDKREVPDAVFEREAIEIFAIQAEQNPVYEEFISRIGIKPADVKRLRDIPFLPVEFFKTHRILTGAVSPEVTFLSSGTGTHGRSKHLIPDIRHYRDTVRRTFEYFYGDVSNYHILALLPSYMEQGDSSLIEMVRYLMQISRSEHNGFYLYNHGELLEKIICLKRDAGRKILLIGVSYALLDFAAYTGETDLSGVIMMETGGMKGRRKELVREELHRRLIEAFHTEMIHSEYGMTELTSQAYSPGNGIFRTPPWMKVLIREPEDPFSYLDHGRTGGINIIDLANRHSCAFIATQDLGKCYPDGRFEVLGRFDSSDIRGCNLMIG